MVDIVKKSTYVVGDKEFNVWEDALNYSIKLEKEQANLYDPFPDVEGLEKRFSVSMYGTKKQISLNPNLFGYSNKMPLLLMIQDKYSKYNYYIDTVETLKNVSLNILANRVEHGFLYENQDAKLSKAIVETQNGGAAFVFLSERKEYEYFQLEEFDKI